MRNQTSLMHAKRLRTEQTPVEAKLWHVLRGKRFVGLKFRRQTVVGPYIIDFTCRAAMLAIEIDGDTHGAIVEADAQRTAFIETFGWRVVRFTNADVIDNLEGVLERIVELVADSPSP
jgi:very-short-patch-repair endonuclease